MIGAPSKLTIKRKIPELPVSASVDCCPGQISVLRDDDGSVIKDYEHLLTNPGGDGRGGLEFRGAVASSSDLRRIGFERAHFEAGSISEYLVQNGFDPQEAEEVIDRYELRDFTYLPLKLLPDTARRQLELITLARSHAEVVLLNDPFLPFNGRWREAFAQMVLDFAKVSGAVVVVVNLSFRPKAWGDLPEISVLDVGAENRKAVECHLFAEERQRREREKAEVKKLDSGEKAKPTRASAHESPQPSEDPALENLPPLLKGFYDKKDRVFAPLARFSNTVRALSGALSLMLFCALIGTMGFAMYPEAKQNWPKMARLADKLDYSFQSLLWWRSETSAPAPEAVVETEPRAETEETSESHAGAENTEMIAALRQGSVAEDEALGGGSSLEVALPPPLPANPDAIEQSPLELSVGLSSEDVSPAAVWLESLSDPQEFPAPESEAMIGASAEGWCSAGEGGV